MPRGEQGGGATYISIYNGQFEQRLKSAQEGSKIRTKKDGTEIHVLHFGSFTGRIQDVKFEKGKYGLETHVIVQDATETLQIQMKIDSGYSLDFMSRYGNINHNKDIEMTPLMYVEGEKKSFYFLMKQDGFKIERKWGKDTEGMPKWEWIEDELDASKSHWNKNKQVKFLMDLVKGSMPELPASESGHSPEPLPSAGRSSAQSETVASGEEEDDDLPF